MGSIEKSQLPEQALLRRYAESGHYNDCYSTEIGRSVSHARYVTAFYTTLLFRIERFILKWVVSKPSSDADASELAEASRDTFAAWNVEERRDDQLLMSDYAGRTRSWLMVEPVSSTRTRLYFGSAVVRSAKDTDNDAKRRTSFNTLLWFHKVYSVALLYCAKKRLERVE